MNTPSAPGPRIAWLLTDEDGGTELLHERPDYYSGTLKQIVYWEIEQK